MKRSYLLVPMLFILACGDDYQEAATTNPGAGGGFGGAAGNGGNAGTGGGNDGGTGGPQRHSWLDSSPWEHGRTRPHESPPRPSGCQRQPLKVSRGPVK